MIKTGDTVRYLNAVGGGTVVRIEGNMAYVLESDGFETPVLLHECVVVAQNTLNRPTGETTKKPQQTPPVQAHMSKDTTPKPAPQQIAETPGGDTVNIQLAYIPTDIKQLSSTEFEAVLVNDSNYFIYYAYMTSSDLEPKWKTRSAGLLEPNTQLSLEIMPASELPNIDRAAIQYIPFKQDKLFELREPALVQWRLDTTKFCRLHCFHPNIYFEEPVIAYDITLRGEPMRRRPVPDAKAIEDGIRQKKADTRPEKRPVSKRSTPNPDGPVVVDLHISELVDSTRGLSNADMLNLQVDHFRSTMDKYSRKPGTKIIFIHGKGEGVLRQALMKELSHRYKGHDVQDASFREYGYGATQVTIRR